MTTHRTPRLENPGSGGRGASRRRATGWQAERTKEQWANRAADLEDALRDIIRTADDFYSENGVAMGSFETTRAVEAARKLVATI
jgi:hypothetical protein